MKTTLIALFLVFFTGLAKAQSALTPAPLNQTPTDTCSDESGLKLFLNSPKTVRHPINKPYTAAQPGVRSNKFASDKIALVKKSGTVNPYIPGIYKECYEATDPEGMHIECCRTVIVEDTSGIVARVSANRSMLVKVYPNPVQHGFLQVHSPFVAAGETVIITIMDHTGRTCLASTYVYEPDLRVFLPENNWRPGFYTLRLISGDKTLYAGFVAK